MTAYYPFDGDLTDASGGHHDGKAVRGEVVYEDGSVAKAADFSPETQMDFGNVGDFERSQALRARAVGKSFAGSRRDQDPAETRGRRKMAGMGDRCR